MAHAAKVNEETFLVEEVVVIPAEHQHQPQEYLNGLGKEGWWLQTSYNTRGGVNAVSGTPLRKNFAGIGFTYDVARDAFIPPKPFDSWTLNEDTCLWNPPVAYPTDGMMYEWSEDDLDWVAVIN